MVLVKKYNFCYLLILGKISRENVFQHFLDRKKSRSRQQKTSTKKNRKWPFSKVVCP